MGDGGRGWRAPGHGLGHGLGHVRAHGTATLTRVALLATLALAGCRSDAAPGASAPPAAPSAPAAVDTEVTIPVEGMVCGGCEQAIDAALGKLPGVSSVAASHAQERVVVRFDPARVTRSQLEAAITGLGYTVGPPPHPLDPPAGSPAPAP